jgi:hypothetical protein
MYAEPAASVLGAGAVALSLGRFAAAMITSEEMHPIAGTPAHPLSARTRLVDLANEKPLAASTQARPSVVWWNVRSFNGKRRSFNGKRRANNRNACRSTTCMDERQVKAREQTHISHCHPLPQSCLHGIKWKRIMHNHIEWKRIMHKHKTDHRASSGT